MLKDRALEYYADGLNCAQCILKACEVEFGIKISEDCYKGCCGFSNGLGVGSCCGAVLAGIMVIGIMDKNVGYYRLELLEKFKKRFGSFDCCNLQKISDCERLIGEICDFLEKLMI